MPRVAIKKKDYIVTDFLKWLRGEMAVRGIKQSDIAEWLGVSQQAVSIRVRRGTFSLKELLIIFENLGTSKEKIGELFKVN